MKRLPLVALALLVMGTLSPSYAIDRDEKMIDTIGVDFGTYHEIGYFGGSLWVENRLAAKTETWAVVAGIGAGEYDIQDGDNAFSLFAGLGIKYYITSFSSLALVGSYRNFENESDFDILAGIKHILRTNHMMPRDFGNVK